MFTREITDTEFTLRFRDRILLRHNASSPLYRTTRGNESFRITPESHRMLTEETDRLRKGGDPGDAPDGTKETCELLTGLRYDSLRMITEASAE